MNSGRKRVKRRASRASDPARKVFINCPFDEQYKPLFHAAVFAVIDCGFIPRCAHGADYLGMAATWLDEHAA